MCRMGFRHKWIQHIIHCILSVSFSFKYNGCISGALFPSKGLRQGDPISPYLFFVVADAFSRLLSRAAQEGNINDAI